jgi:hypothetical protein
MWNAAEEKKVRNDMVQMTAANLKSMELRRGRSWLSKLCQMDETRVPRRMMLAEHNAA